jgi:outer membrane protein OmpA-like peptidoglycan-associated protein
MIKKIKFLLVLSVSLLFASCKTTTAVGAGGDASGSSSASELSVTDGAIKLNPNDTIDGQFGLGILPNEFVSGEKINHNFLPVYFAYDSAQLDSTENSKLKMLAGFLESNPNLFLIVEGYCDERGSDEYNRALSERRALAVRAFLEAAAPSISARINTMGYGEEKPADTAQTPEAYAKNRRAEFVIISKR